MEESENVKVPAIVEVIDGGALKITGKIILKDFKKDITENPEEVLLCLCGHSGNMPYCDDSHKK